ncbi:MAG: hypothetical protein U0M42_03420 [Acutalibacteraceae bacterium]|nr:hypothetical protein [Acutalibacteraceae bacterium]
MTDVNYSCRNNCLLFAAATSIIVGVITAILTVTATITVANVFYWVALGVAVLFLLVAFITLRGTRNTERYCVCTNVTALLVGILGTVFTALVLLGVAFPATSVFGAIVTGILLAFFSLIITTTACIVRCFTDCRD